MASINRGARLRNYKSAFAVACTNGTADKFYALGDSTRPGFCGDTKLSQLPYRACSGDIVYARTGWVAKRGCNGSLAAGSAGGNFGGVNIDRGPCANVLVYHTYHAVLIDLNPEADKWVYETKINRSVQGQVRVVIYGLYVQVGGELVEDDVVKAWSFAEHLRFPARPAGAAHLCNAVVNFQVAIGEFRLAAAIAV